MLLPSLLQVLQYLHLWLCILSFILISVCGFYFCLRFFCIFHYSYFSTWSLVFSRLHFCLTAFFQIKCTVHFRSFLNVPFRIILLFVSMSHFLSVVPRFVPCCYLFSFQTLLHVHFLFHYTNTFPLLRKCSFSTRISVAFLLIFFSHSCVASIPGFVPF